MASSMKYLDIGKMQKKSNEWTIPYRMPYDNENRNIEWLNEILSKYEGL